MAQKDQPPQIRKRQSANAVEGAFSQPNVSGLPAGSQITQMFQGPVPHPDILREFDRIVPGTAQRMIDLAHSESEHRRTLENKNLEANIEFQKQQIEIAKKQSNVVFVTDMFGQAIGFLLAIACVCGAVYLSMHDHEAVAAALAAIPTAAVIRAFFVNRQKHDAANQA